MPFGGASERARPTPSLKPQNFVLIELEKFKAILRFRAVVSYKSIYIRSRNSRDRFVSTIYLFSLIATWSGIYYNIYNKRKVYKKRALKGLTSI